ncbi:MAG: hypothetical protein EBS49_08950 [Verrucomicrobia bacterium]|nr:hypothetical protein [Verrucomicrobiota bacterium]NBU69717.1 hypothetical protein [Verrucomicrobiota bacterium]
MSRNQIRRTNRVGDTRLVLLLLGAGVLTMLAVIFALLHVTNIRAATELKKMESAHARLDDLVKSARLQAEKLRSPRHLSERSAAMNLGLVSVSQLEVVEAPARRLSPTTDLAREASR